MAKIEGPIHELGEDDLKRVHKLWNEEYPVGIYYPELEDFQGFLTPLGRKQHYYVKKNGQIVAWVICFDRDQGRWFSIIIAKDLQGVGLGNELMQHVLSREENLQGWVVDHDRDIKEDGSPYVSPLPFYLKLGFKVDATRRFERAGISCVRIYHKSQ